MSALSERLRSIPRAAWFTGVFITVPIALILAFGPLQYDAELRSFPSIAKVGILLGPACLLFFYSLLVGFIYADAKRRGMRHVMWAWLAIVPYFVGVILYFILRNPLPTPCPECSAAVPQSFAYCPHCGASVHPVCVSCGKSLQADWASCPHCGTRIAPSGVVTSPESARG